ncbi:unnamed protein product [Cuscuta campestris]|uniref:Uncharacterized protein n=1 Tax=Cuscuta campestris TaxID=132261 RepID=A0A484LVP8_9ASTE|nr:unnamed protein product [Cuscuta campestris]
MPKLNLMLDRGFFAGIWRRSSASPKMGEAGRRSSLANRRWSGARRCWKLLPVAGPGGSPEVAVVTSALRRRKLIVAAGGCWIAAGSGRD